ncbi:MAG: leucyl aminopeptidase family protein [Myxococcota bacterium]
MIKLSYAKNLAAIKDVGTLLLVGSQSVLESKNLSKLVGPDLARFAGELARDTKPGDLGGVGSTLTGGAPRKLVLGVLPERISRYNAEARPESVHRVVSGSGIGRAKGPKNAIVLILDKDQHLLPSLNAIGRAFPLFSRESKTTDDVEIAVLFLNKKGSPVSVDVGAIQTMENARNAARLVDTPPSELNTEALADEAKRALAGLKSVKITEYVGDELLEHGLRGVYSVGKAAVAAPRVLIAQYRPAKASGPQVALVGKGITFDTGGLHIKARGFMEGMKSDMGGAAAVLMAFRTLVEAKPARKLTLIVCMAENAIGPTAYKPDDILTLHSGKTVEINNTDAEGRLLLADGVSYAARVLGAEIILDAATLTGAQPMSTGMIHAAVMSNDARLERLLVEAGHKSGDLCHPLPFAPEFFQSEFKSPIADMRNSAKNRSNAQSSCAGQFIYSHIEDTGVRWGHVDLAGPAWRGDRGTGYGVALLAETVRGLKASS